MPITYSLNQATPLPIKGQSATGYTLSTQEGAINPASTSVIAGGTAVKINGSAGGQSLFDKAAADENIVGFVKYDPTYNGGDPAVMAGKQVTLLISGSTMIMEAGETINAGAKVQIVASGDKVINDDGDTVIGMALTSGVNGDLIQVQISI